MAGRIKDLLEEKQKDAELLIQNLESVDEMIVDVRENFIQRLKFQVFTGSMKHASESIHEIEKWVKEWHGQFENVVETEKKQLDQLQTDTVELGQHVQT